MTQANETSEAAVAAPQRDSSSLGLLIRALKAPMGWPPPGLISVSVNASKLLAPVRLELPKLAKLLPDLSPITGKIDRGVEEASAAQINGMGLRLRDRHPEWLLLLEEKNFECEQVKMLVAYELTRTLVVPNAEFRWAQRLLDMSRLSGQDREGELRRLHKLSSLVRADLQCLESGSKTRSQLGFETLLVSYLGEQLKPRGPATREERAEAVLSEGSLIQLLQALPSSAESGDDLACALMSIFSAPLSLKLFLRLPLIRHTGEDWMACMDLSSGTIKIDLSAAVKNMAGPTRASESASPVGIFHVPPRALNLLRERYRENPDARVAGDLLSEAIAHVRGRSALKYGNLPTQPTVARILRSRAVAVQAAGLDRVDGAYAAGAFAVLGKPILHYLTVSRADIAAAARRYHSFLGWGEEEGQEIAPEAGVAVGSQSTPTWAAMKQVDEAFITGFRKAQIGPNSGWAALMEFHFRYTLLVGHRIAFFLLGRRKAALEAFPDWHSGELGFGFNPDKRTEPTKGLAPIPISPLCAQQIKLLHLHLAALRSRARKRAPRDVLRALESRVEAVLNGEHANALFVFQGTGLQSIGTADLDVVHPHVDVREDFRRHFIATHMKRFGLSASDLEIALKHHVDCYSPHEGLSMTDFIQAAERCSNAIDSIGMQLGMTPVAGLSSTKPR